MSYSITTIATALQVLQGERAEILRRIAATGGTPSEHAFLEGRLNPAIRKLTDRVLDEVDTLCSRS